MSRNPRLLCAVAFAGSASMADSYVARAPARSPSMCCHAPRSLAARDSRAGRATAAAAPVNGNTFARSIRNSFSGDPLDETRQDVARIDVRHLELHVAQRNVERFPF